MGQGQVSQAAWSSRDKRHEELLPPSHKAPGPLASPLAMWSSGSLGASTPGHAVTFASVILFLTHRRCPIGSAQQVLLGLVRLGGTRAGEQQLWHLFNAGHNED